MKKIYLVFFAFLILLLLTGCTTEYNKNDIKKYVNNELNLYDITITKNPETIEGSDGYSDKLWTITDNKNNIVFHVLDDYHWGMESLSNNLKNDYDSSVFIHLYNDMDIKDNITLNFENNNGLNNVSLTGYFKNENELRKAYESLLSYKNYISSKKLDLEIYYSLKYHFAIRKIGDYEIEQGDSYGLINNLDENVYNNMLINYFSCALNFQIEDALSEMDINDLNNVMNHPETHRIFITRENGEIEYYSDIIADTYHYGISFGTLYKILEKEKFILIGNPWHFSVTTKSGDTYEFSYDFNDALFENEQMGYYYIKNNEKIKMSSYFYNCLGPKTINTMFNLNIGEKANRFM